MTVENSVRLLAGSMVGISLVLYYLVSPWFLLLAAFVSLNLMQSAFTGICPAEKFFKRSQKKSEPANPEQHPA
jgi:hypothetical protein